MARTGSAGAIAISIGRSGDAADKRALVAVLDPFWEVRDVVGLLVLLVVGLLGPTEAPWCGNVKLTAYVRTEFSPWTYDGTDVRTEEKIVAASWDVKMGSLADIDGLGTFRVADRGHLGNGVPHTWVDVAVWSRAEAYALTGFRRVCFRRPTT